MIRRWPKPKLLLAVIGLVIVLMASLLALNRLSWQDVLQVVGQGITYRLAWSPTGKSLVLVGSRGLSVCEANLRSCQWLFDQEERVSVAYSPDGSRLAIGTPHGSVEVWDISAKQRLAELSGLTGRIRAVAYSFDGERLAAGGEDGNIDVWQVPHDRIDLWSQTPLELHAHTAAVMALAFSPACASDLTAHCEQTLASSSRDGTAQLWDATTGEAGPLLNTPDWGQAINDIAWSPTGSSLATVGQYGYVSIWNRDGVLQATLHSDINKPDQPHYILQWHEMLSVDWSSDGHWLITSGKDGQVRVWDAVARSLQAQLQPELAETQVLRVRFQPSSTRFSLATDSGTVAIWDIDRDVPIATLENPTAQVNHLAINPNGHMFATSSQNGDVALWTLGETTPWFSQRAHTGEVTTLQFSPDGRWLITGSMADTLRIWDATTGHLVQSLPIDSGVNSACFSPDGTWLFISTAHPDDKAPAQARYVISRWRFHSGQDVQFDGEWETLGLTTVDAIHPAGGLLLAGATLWDPLTGEERGRGRIQVPGGWPINNEYYAFSPNGRWLAVASSDHQVYLRDTQDTFWNGPTLSGHEAAVLAVTFSPNSLALASADAKGVIRLWDVATARQVRTLMGHTGAVDEIAFTPDGQRLISIGADGTLRVWNTIDIAGSATLHSIPIAPVLPASPEQAWSVQPRMTVGSFHRLYPDLLWGANALGAQDDTLIAVGERLYQHRLSDDERLWNEIKSRQGVWPPWAVAVVSADDFWVGGLSGQLVHYHGPLADSVSVPSKNHIWDIKMLTPNDGWIAGENGTIWHYQDQHWLTVTVPTTHTLYALDFVTPDEAWAAGRDGTLLHYANGTWRLAPSPTQEHLRGLDMVSPDLGWAVGAHGTILRFDGQTWQRVTSPITTNLHSVSAPAPNVAWAVGADGAMVYFDGTQWQNGPRFTDADMWTVLMLSPDEGWAMSGESVHNVTLHYHNGAWHPVTSPSVWSVLAADMTENAGWLFARDEHDRPQVMRYQNAQWQTAPEVNFEVKAVDLVSDTEAWAVNGKHLYHWIGGVWKNLDAPCYLEDVQLLNAQTGWSVGAQCALHLENGTWISITVPADVSLHAVSVLSADEAWALGRIKSSRSGSIFHFHNGRVDTLESPTDDWLEKIDMLSATEGWVSAANAGDGSLYHYLNGQWIKAPIKPDEIVDLKMRSPQDGWAVSNRGEVWRYSWGQWTLLANLSDFTQAIVPLPKGEVWVFGSEGGLWHGTP